MKIIAKTKNSFFDNKAESMAEVTVAFMVLVIIVTLYATCMQSANRVQSYAVGRTRDTDKAMEELIKTAVLGIDEDVVQAGSTTYESLDNIPDLIIRRDYTVYSKDGGDHIVYVVFDANIN